MSLPDSEIQILGIITLVLTAIPVANNLCIDKIIMKVTYQQSSSVTQPFM